MWKSKLRTIHIYLGLLVSIPVLAWSISGFFLALPPGTISGEPYRPIETTRVKLSAHDALQRVKEVAGKEPVATSIALEQRGDKISYSLFGSAGAFKVDAESGEVTKPKGPDAKTKLIRHAHFFNFAGSARTWLLGIFSLLSTLSTVTGIILLVQYFRR